MTQTKTHRSKTGTYTTTIESATTPDGRPGFRIECTCATHPEGMTAAIVLDNSAITGKPFPRSYVHGTVTQAHHPVIGKALVRNGIWAV